VQKKKYKGVEEISYSIRTLTSLSQKYIGADTKKNEKLQKNEKPKNVPKI
jgi:hypothetical protein